MFLQLYSKLKLFYIQKTTKYEDMCWQKNVQTKEKSYKSLSQTDSTCWEATSQWVEILLWGMAVFVAYFVH